MAASRVRVRELVLPVQKRMWKEICGCELFPFCVLFVPGVLAGCVCGLQRPVCMRIVIHSGVVVCAICASVPASHHRPKSLF